MAEAIIEHGQTGTVQTMFNDQAQIKIIRNPFFIFISVV